MQTQEIKDALAELHSIISPAQMRDLLDDLKAERNQMTNSILSAKFTARYIKCPRSYQTDGQRGEAVAQFRYFLESSEVFITELDMCGAPHHQAFGFASMNNYPFELGYVSIPELLSVGFKLDYQFVPKTVRELGLWKK